MKRFAVWTVLVLIAGGLWAQDSLWEPGSQGFYTGKIRMKEGDLLRVNLDTEASLSFSSSKNSDKLVTFEFTKAGQGGNPLDFLPGLKSGDNLKLQTKNELKTKNTGLVVQVKAVNLDGSLVVQGTRSVSFPSGTDTISLNGLIDPRDVKNREVLLKNVGELRLVFATAAESTSQVLSPADYAADGRSLTPEKQKALLQAYYNRFLDVLFPAH